MQSRASVIFAAGMNLEAAFETGEAAAVAVVFEALPRIEAAQINIAEDHAAEVGQVRDAALELRRRIDPDPLAKYLLALTAALLLFLAYFAYHH